MNQLIQLAEMQSILYAYAKYTYLATPLYLEIPREKPLLFLQFNFKQKRLYIRHIFFVKILLITKKEALLEIYLLSDPIYSSRD